MTPRSIDWNSPLAEEQIMRGQLQSLRRLLDSLATSVGEAKQIADELALGKRGPYWNLAVEDQGYLIDSLMGCMFVVCQTFITGVVSWVKRRLSMIREDGKQRVRIMKDSKHAIMAFEAVWIKDTGYSGIQVLDAFANYFKHGEEWESSWDPDKLNERQLKTAQIISAMGAAPTASHNCWTGAAALGNESGDQPESYLQLLQTWFDRLASALSGAQPDEPDASCSM